MIISFHQTIIWFGILLTLSSIETQSTAGPEFPPTRSPNRFFPPPSVTTLSPSFAATITTRSPTRSPTLTKTITPTHSPTHSPTRSPTVLPTTISPTTRNNKTNVPTHSPTLTPTVIPTVIPTTVSPTTRNNKTNDPTESPTPNPTVIPTTVSPTTQTTTNVSLTPTTSPSINGGFITVSPTMGRDPNMTDDAENATTIPFLTGSPTTMPRQSNVTTTESDGNRTESPKMGGQDQGNVTTGSPTIEYENVTESPTLSVENEGRNVTTDNSTSGSPSTVTVSPTASAVTKKPTTLRPTISSLPSQMNNDPNKDSVGTPGIIAVSIFIPMFLVLGLVACFLSTKSKKKRTNKTGSSKKRPSQQ